MPICPSARRFVQIGNHLDWPLRDAMSRLSAVVAPRSPAPSPRVRRRGEPGVLVLEADKWSASAESNTPTLPRWARKD